MKYGHYDEFGEHVSEYVEKFCAGCGYEIEPREPYYELPDGKRYCWGCVDSMRVDPDWIDEYDMSGEDELNEAV